jgi:transcriptional regulator with XRE-family HTH domain
MKVSLYAKKSKPKTIPKPINFFIFKPLIKNTSAQDRFIAVREALGITQRDFCKGIYVSQSYYAQIEGGKRPVNDRIIALVCSQYGVSKEFLLTGKGEMFSKNLADIQLQQLIEKFSQLEPPFKEYVISQIEELVDAVKKQKGPSTPKSRKRPRDT